MAIIRWGDEWRTGDAMVDDQHRGLFEIVNDLHEAVHSGAGQEAAVATVTALVSYVIKHFRAEEALMKKHRYPEFLAHCTLHENLTREVRELLTKVRAGEPVPLDELSEFAAKWLAEHIDLHDKRMVAWVRARKAEMSPDVVRA
ncbi:MAG: hemerythrin family protein [Deltaproteobacteria bacterium]|nr:hemerythrin family protein [Deltaproteobacteria bacterium]